MEFVARWIGAGGTELRLAGTVKESPSRRIAICRRRRMPDTNQRLDVIALVARQVRQVQFTVRFNNRFDSNGVHRMHLWQEGHLSKHIVLTGTL